MRRSVLNVAIGALLLATTPAIGFGQQAAGAEQPQVTFKAGVEAVTVSAAVRDTRGRVVQGLQKADFQIFDGRLGSYTTLFWWTTW